MSTIIKHKEFTNHKVYKTEVAGRPLTIDVGKVAELATASAMVTYGETTVLVAVTVSPRPRDGVDFFPLSVDFEEKLYAVGRIPGSFMRREGQPSLPAVLASRVIDRSIRPLFPYDFRNDVVVTATVMSVDRDCSPEVTAMIGVSACLAYSCIPWAGPIGCLEVGYVDGQIVLNPTNEQKHASQLDLTVAATDKKVIMIEAGAKELPDDIMYDAIVAAHEDIKKQVAFINQIVAEIGRDKMTYDHADFDQELFDKIVEATMDEARAAMDTDDKNVREARWNQLIEKWHQLFLEDYPEMDKYLDEITYKFQKKIVKAWLLEGHRVDGRAKNEIRPLAAEVGVLPRVHGSGLFTRGQTQVLSVCTLNTCLLYTSDLLELQAQQALGGVLHDPRLGGDAHGEAAGDVDADVLAGQSVFQIHRDGHGGQIQELIGLDDRPDKGRAAVDALGAAGGAVLVAAHLAVDDHNLVRGALLVALDQEQQQGEDDDDDDAGKDKSKDVWHKFLLILSLLIRMEWVPPAGRRGRPDR